MKLEIKTNEWFKAANWQFFFCEGDDSKGDKFCRKEEKALRNSLLFTSGNHELLFSSWNKHFGILKSYPFKNSLPSLQFVYNLKNPQIKLKKRRNVRGRL